MPGRIARHILTTRRALDRAFPASTLAAIERAVHEGESLHAGEVRFAVEMELDWRQLVAGVTARQRALEVFSALRVWDTEANNGVLIYVLFADRDVEIVADRGFNGKVTTADWQGICRSIRDRFAAGEFEGGILGGIEAVSRLMATHVPAPAGGGRNEMPDRPVLL